MFLLTLFGQIHASQIDDIRPLLQSFPGLAFAERDFDLEDDSKFASRSCVVYFKNNSECNFTCSDFAYSYTSVWTEAFPPYKIASNSCASWASESGGILSGTRGWAKYLCDQCGYAVVLKWKDPLVGKNRYKSKSASGYDITQVVIEEGKNAVVCFSLNKFSKQKELYLPFAKYDAILDLSIL